MLDVDYLKSNKNSRKHLHAGASAEIFKIAMYCSLNFNIQSMGRGQRDQWATNDHIQVTINSPYPKTTVHVS